MIAARVPHAVGNMEIIDGWQHDNATAGWQHKEPVPSINIVDVFSANVD
jgi:hypothetical protein